VAGRKASWTGPRGGRGGGGAVRITRETASDADGRSPEHATPAHAWARRTACGHPAEPKTTGSSLTCRIRVQGAVIKEQGVTFAIVVVKWNVVQNSIEAARAQRNFSSVFPGIPIILMAQDSRGVPTYYGRPDIVRFLSRISMNRIPWKEYTV